VLSDPTSEATALIVLYKGFTNSAL